MAKVKAYELSKSLGIPSKELVQVLHDYKVSDKSHMSTLDDNELNIIFEYVTQKYQAEDLTIIFPKKEEKAPKPKYEKKAKKRDDGEVIEIEIPDVSEEVIPARKVRVVDTRANAVDLDHLDTEKLEELIPENVKNEGAKKQKIKNNKKNLKSNKDRNQDEMSQVVKKEKKEVIEVMVPDEITVGELAERMKKPATEIIKKLMLLGIMASVNEVIDFDTATLVVEDFGGTIEKEIIVTEEDKLFNDVEDSPES